MPPASAHGIDMFNGSGVMAGQYFEQNRTRPLKLSGAPLHRQIEIRCNLYLNDVAITALRRCAHGGLDAEQTNIRLNVGVEMAARLLDIARAEAIRNAAAPDTPRKASTC